MTLFPAKIFPIGSVAVFPGPPACIPQHPGVHFGPRQGLPVFAIAEGWCLLTAQFLGFPVPPWLTGKTGEERPVPEDKQLLAAGR